MEQQYQIYTVLNTSNEKIIPDVRFYLKIRRCENTTNGNGYATYTLEWAWFKKRGSWWFYTQKLGNGDNGERCAS